MQIDKAELERRLKSQNNLANTLGLPTEQPKTLVEDKPTKQYTPQIKDESTRILAGTLAHLDKPSNVARELGLTPQQVHSAAHSQNPTIRRAVDETRDRVSELALNQLLGTLGLLTPDALIGEKPKDLSQIAANLSRVVQNMTPRETGDGPRVNVVIYAPPQKTEDKYRTIDV